MTTEQPLKPVVWIGSSRKDLRAFPEPVQYQMGYALYVAQLGGKHREAKALRGFGGAGVVELIRDHQGDTYRTVYTVRLRDALYVLHAFQKKSKEGRATPRREIELVKQRLREAEEISRRRES